MRLEGTFIGSRTGRRVFALFGLAALLPVAVLALLVARQIGFEQQRAAQEQRLALAKAFALAVLERLDTASRIVERLSAAPADADALAPLFAAVHVLEPDAGDPQARALHDAVSVATPSTRLFVLPAAEGKAPAVAIVRRGLAGRASLAAVLAPEFLWGRVDELPQGFAPCVEDAEGRALFCPAGVGASAVSWPLFLTAAFGVEPWRFTASVGPGLAPTTSGVWSLLGWAVAGTLLLAALLSLVQLRRTLGPLERLVAKTGEVAAGDYRPLSLPRDTEFGQLAAAFDAMGERIDRQIATLRALGEVDRRILAALDLEGIFALVLALLEAAGVSAERVLPLSVRDRPVGAVALGVDADAARLPELRELGERVGVALAAKERDDLLVFQARHDALTGLPNRFDAIETLNGALRRAQAAGGRVAVLFIDLDRFKAINDGLGHAVGDAVLAEVARTLGRHLPPGCYVARYGGDEFIAVLEPAGEPADVAAAAAALAAAIAAPIRVGATELELHCSVGIALHPGDGDQAEALLRNADIAMYRAKQSGRGQCVFFEERMNLEAASRIRLQADLRGAIRDRALHLEFQPRVDTRDGRIVGAEALARWIHPQEGPVPPPLFVRLAEDAGLIDALGEWAIEEACAAFALWRTAGVRVQCVSVNVSARQLTGEGIVAQVRGSMARHGLRPGELELEMTESVLARDLAAAASRLEMLRDAGASIAVDDFGTGYSSLAYLRRLPVDTIKIDRSFIVDMVGSHSALALARAIVAMGEALGKQIVAEGVENDEQAAILRSWGCHFVQGFALYPPLGARRMLDELLAP